MRLHHLTSAAAACALLLVLQSAGAQEPPRPGPEHAKLKQLEGTWDAVVKMGPEESKAVATYKMDVGGLWLVSTFEGEFGAENSRAEVSTATTPPRRNTSASGSIPCPPPPWSAKGITTKMWRQNSEQYAGLSKFG